MKLNILKITSKSVFCEAETGTGYYSSKELSIYIDGRETMKSDKNCFMISDLQPETSYKLMVSCGSDNVSCEITTLVESALLEVTDFGAIGDGKYECTGSFQAAIAACPEGGTVYVPKGEYLCYPLFLKSDMMLYLSDGAHIIGGLDRNRYPILPGMIKDENLQDCLNLGSWEGNPLDTFAALITSIHTKNTIICGLGTIDGQAHLGDWWNDVKTKRGAWRPRLIHAIGCTGFTIMGVNVKNSPSWTVHPYYCNHLEILGIHITNPYDSPNTDGIDPESCEDVVICGTDISVGDDCVALKSGKYYMAKNHYKRCSNIMIRNCMFSRGHGAVVVGSEAASGVDTFTIESCVFVDTDRGLRIKTRRGRGSTCVFDNIKCSNTEMRHVLTPFSINMFYCCDPDGKSEYVKSKDPLSVDEMTPHIMNIDISNVRCHDAEYVGIFIYGLPESPVQSVNLDDVVITFKKEATEGMPDMMEDIPAMKKISIYAVNVTKLHMHNVSIEGFHEGDKYISNTSIVED